MSMRTSMRTVKWMKSWTETEPIEASAAGTSSLGGSGRAILTLLDMASAYGGDLPPEDAPESVKVTFQLVAGSAAALVSKTLVAPLDRVKIILQVQRLSTAPPELHYRGLLDALRRIPAQQGVWALWRGNGANVARIVPNAAIKFALFERTRDLLSHFSGGHRVQWSHRLAAGAISGGASLVILYPLDYARTLVAADWTTRQQGRLYPGAFRWIAQTARSSGLLALFRGIGVSVLGVVPYQATVFTVYDTFKQYLPDRRTGVPTTAPKLAAAASAAVIAQTLTYPFDTLRRRLQVNGLAGYQRPYRGTLDAVVQTARVDGVRSLFSGVGINALRSVPGTALQLVLYDYFKQLLLPEL